MPASVTVSCEYTTKPGAKSEYSKVSTYRRDQRSKEKIDSYSGSAEVSGSYAGVKAAVKGSWANSHSFSTSSDQESKREVETKIEYYEGVTLLKRKLKFTYLVDGASMEHEEEEIVQNVDKPYSTDQLFKEAQAYMQRLYGSPKTVLEIPLQLSKELRIEWVPKRRNEELPPGAVYAGTTSTDGQIYVGRFASTPGKVNLDNSKVYNFWVQNEGSRDCGEVLATNGNVNWVDIKRNELIPRNAVYSGKDRSGDKVWVGRNRGGEAGKINCHDNNASNPKMWNIWCHAGGSSSNAQILTISQ